MADKVITGAVIKLQARSVFGTFNIGRALALRISEQYGVRPIYGIGAINAQELPILQYAGTMSISQFAIDTRAAENVLSQFKRQGSTGVSTVDQFIKQLLYAEGVDVTVTRREKVTGASADQPVPTDREVSYLKVTGAICTGEEISIDEGSVVVRSGSFVFSNPVSV